MLRKLFLNLLQCYPFRHRLRHFFQYLPNYIEKIRREEREKLEKIRLAKEKLADKTVKPVVVGGFGAVIGALLGGSLGVAGKLAGVMIAVNGGWILAPIGAVFGFLGVKAFNKKNKENKK